MQKLKVVMNNKNSNIFFCGVEGAICSKKSRILGYSYCCVECEETCNNCITTNNTCTHKITTSELKSVLLEKKYSEIDSLRKQIKAIELDIVYIKKILMSKNV